MQGSSDASHDYMRRLLTLCGLAVVLCAGLPATSSAASRSDYELGRFYPLDEVDDAVVHRVTGAVVRFNGATGFIIHADGYILTNHHVRASFGRAGTVHRRVTDRGFAEMLDVELVFDDERHDIALYRVIDTPGPFPAVELATRAPTPGEPVFVLGHPSSSPLRASFGRVLANDLEIGGRPSVEYSAQTWWGSSGSPVFDAGGRVLAIHWGWDSEGISNGRLTGVPLDVIGRGVPAMRPFMTAPQRPVAPACDDPSGWSLRTTRLAEGARLDELEVTLVPPSPACGDAVSAVQYSLHPSFGNPTPRVDGMRPLALRAWGSFAAGVEVILDDGGTLTFSDRVAW